MGFLFIFSLKILQVEVGISYLISRFHLNFFFILISPHQQHRHHQNHQQHHHREHREADRLRNVALVTVRDPG